MPEARNPFDQLKAIKSFHQFIEEQAIAYFECDEPIRVAFKRMADAVGGSDPIKKPQRISRKTNAIEARADQLISEMQILRSYNATAFLEAITKRWCMSKGPETCITGMLLNHALTRQKNPLIELLKETDESSTELLNMKHIRMSIKTIPDDILDELKESRTPEIAERLREKARQLQLELSDIRHWNGFLDYKLSDVAKRFHSVMSIEFPFPKPVRSKKSSEPPPPSEPLPPTTMRTPKRSTSRGDARLKLVAAITKHHCYADGSCLNPEPIGNNQLAALANVSKSSASQFFENQFKGYKNYKLKCRNTGALVMALKILNQEIAPHHVLGDSSSSIAVPDERHTDDQ